MDIDRILMGWALPALVFGVVAFLTEAILNLLDPASVQGV